MTGRNEAEGSDALDAIRLWLTREWGNAFQSVLESMTGSRPGLAWRLTEERPPLPAGEDAPERWWSCSLSIQAGPVVWVGAPEQSWRTLGRSVLDGLGVEDASEDDVSSTCRDLVAQSASVLAQAMAKRFGMGVTSGDVAPGDPPRACRPAGCDLAPPGIAFRVAFQEELLQRLSDGADAEADDPSSGVEIPWLTDGAEAESEAPPSRGADALPERFHDLPVTLHVTLGRVDLRLGEVFKLTVGSVVEVGRLVTDPVDIVGNDNLIAKGQVVVCKGNYGVRIVSLGAAS